MKSHSKPDGISKTRPPLLAPTLSAALWMCVGLQALHAQTSGENNVPPKKDIYELQEITSSPKGEKPLPIKLDTYLKKLRTENGVPEPAPVDRDIQWSADKGDPLFDPSNGASVELDFGKPFVKENTAEAKKVTVTATYSGPATVEMNPRTKDVERIYLDFWIAETVEGEDDVLIVHAENAQPAADDKKVIHWAKVVVKHSAPSALPLKLESSGDKPLYFYGEEQDPNQLTEYPPLEGTLDQEYSDGEWFWIGTDAKGTGQAKFKAKADAGTGYKDAPEEKTVTLLPVEITVNGTSELDDDYLFGDSLGKSENPKADMSVAIADSTVQWTAALSTQDDTITFVSATLSDSSASTEISIKKGHVFTAKQTKDLKVNVTIGSDTHSFTHKVDLFPVVTAIGSPGSDDDDYLIGDSLGVADNPETNLSVTIPGFTESWSVSLSEQGQVVEFGNATLSNSSTDTPIGIKTGHTFSAKETKDLNLSFSINSMTFDLTRKVDLFPVVVTINGTTEQDNDFYIGDALGRITNPTVNIEVDIVGLTDSWDIGVSQNNSSEQFIEFDEAMLSSTRKSTGSRIRSDFQFNAQDGGNLEFYVTAGGMTFTLVNPFNAYPVYITVNDTEESGDDHLFGNALGGDTNPKINISAVIVDYDNGAWNVDLSAGSNPVIEFDQTTLTDQQSSTKVKIKDAHAFDVQGQADVKFTVSLDSTSMELEYEVDLYPVKISVNGTPAIDDDCLIGDALGKNDNPKADLSVNIIGLNGTWSAGLSEPTSVVEFDDPTLGNTTTDTKILIKKGHVFSVEETKDMKLSFSVGSLAFEFQHETKLLPAELTVSKAKLTLLEENTLKIKGADKFPSGLLDGVKFEIKKDGETTWYLIQDDPADAFTGKARVAGKFELRATLDLNGHKFELPKKPVEAQFPDSAEILAGAGVSARMDQAWTNTQNTTTTTQRREEGYFITLDTNESKEIYGITNYTVGPLVDNSTGASVSLGNSPADVPPSPSPLQSAIYVVGVFHTHTSMEHRGPAGSARGVGPSPSDTTNAGIRRIPSYVYDYTGTVTLTDGSAGIEAGHPTSSAAQIYTYGQSRRDTP